MILAGGSSCRKSRGIIMVNANKAIGRAPKYVQVKEEVKRKILSKEWSDGSRIPVESEFCDMFGVSRITVRKALEELQTEGYLVKIQGKGTFVSNEQLDQRLSKFYSFSEELRSKGIEEYARIKELSVINADEKLASRLQIPTGSAVYKVYRLRATDQGPYAVETSYIPCGLVSELSPEAINNNGLYKTLSAQGINVSYAQETFKAINVNNEQSKLLDVRVDAAGIFLRRLAYDGTTIVEYCESIVRGDFFSYSVELK